jgi:acyl-CoA reductase-like NAD-dependent aldehyde dehydrogenase
MSSLRHYPNWVNGAYESVIDERTHITIINPATESSIATTDSTPLEKVNSVVASSLRNFSSGAWSRADASTRYGVLSKAANLLRARLPEFIDLETQQTGRPIREMRAQLQRIPEWLEYCASLARTHEGRVTPFKGPVINTLTRLPLGVVVQITPWNHPLLIATKKMAAALAAGNSVIVKPSESAPLSVLGMGVLFQEAGLPDGTL